MTPPSAPTPTESRPTSAASAAQAAPLSQPHPEPLTAVLVGGSGTSSEADTAASALAPITLASPIERILRQGCTLVAFVLPIRLSITYLVLVPLLLLWWATVLGSWFSVPTTRLLGRAARAARPIRAADRGILAPLLFFLLSVVISAALGVNPTHSFRVCGSLLFFSATVVLFLQHAALRPVLGALIAGQTVAGIHSTLESAFPAHVARLFHGAVTESGQLTLTTIAALGLLWSTAREVASPPTSRQRLLPMLAGAAGFIGLTTLGFHASLPHPVAGAVVGISVCLVGLAAALLSVRAAVSPQLRQLTLLAAVQLPVLLTALLVNLKRGPWVGVLVGGTVFLVTFAPRLAVLGVGLATAAAVGITPIWERIAASYEHFTISGGRSTIWRIGAELIAQFPLGIGYHNGKMLREFAPEIPPELRHFHNNILNITAENGWLTGAIFLWFICAVVRRSFSRPLTPLYAAIGCAFIGWQVAGLGEYNVGDSEVVLIAWVLLGSLLADQGARREHAAPYTPCSRIEPQLNPAPTTATTTCCPGATSSQCAQSEAAEPAPA